MTAIVVDQNMKSVLTMSRKVFMRSPHWIKNLSESEINSVKTEFTVLAHFYH